MIDEIRPGVTFFFVVAGNDDGTLYVTSEGITPHLSFDDALANAHAFTTDHGGAHFVVECTVAARSSRGPVRITKYGSHR